MKVLTHGSLFSGIGGFDLAAEWMGWENVFHCEKEKFCQRILKYYWPQAALHDDIKTTDFTIYNGRIDVLSGGFPCQPYSAAGKRLGTEDDRHLWPQMLRAIREIQPGYVVGENVRGLTNWNGGMVFDQVQADLEAEGYQVLPFLLPACAVNAPHRRDRIWFVAYSISAGTWRKRGKIDNERGGTSKDWGASIRQTHGEAGAGGSNAAGLYATHTGSEQLQERTPQRDGQDSAQETAGLHNRTERHGDIKNVTDTRLQRPQISQEQTAGIEQCGEGDVTDTNSEQRYEGRLHSPGCEQAERHTRTFNSRNDRGAWQDFPTQSPLCSRNDVLSGKLDGITFSKWRNESIKGYGNAVVPELVYQIFKCISS